MLERVRKSCLNEYRAIIIARLKGAVDTAAISCGFTSGTLIHALHAGHPSANLDRRYVRYASLRTGTISAVTKISRQAMRNGPYPSQKSSSAWDLGNGSACRTVDPADAVCGISSQATWSTLIRNSTSHIHLRCEVLMFWTLTKHASWIRCLIYF